MSKAKSVLIYGRFSSAIQGEDKADSKRRQTESASKWAERNGYAVRGIYFDEGVSSKIGKNLDKEFSRLLAKLNPNEGILVEDLDRISRMHPWKVKGILFDLIMDGHNIVVWGAGKERVYSETTLGELESILMGDIQSALSHQENKKKQFRQLERWQGWIKDIEAGKKVKCTKTAGWLEYKDEKYYVKKGMRETIERIFTMANDGIGSMRTVKQLIKDNVPAVAGNSKSTWNDAFIRDLLKNKAVIGTLVLKEREFLDYYPRIITDDLFYAVQNRVNRYKNKGGRPSDYYGQGNLFTGLLKCKQCKSSFNLANRYDGYAYLVCSNARLTKGCEFHSVKYYDLEDQFINFFESFSFVNLFDNKTENDKQKECTLNGKLEDAEKQIAKYSKLIQGDDNPSKTMINDLKRFELEKEELLVQIENLKMDTRADNVDITRIHEVQREVVSQYKKPEYRMKLKAFIQSIVKKIEIDAPNKSYDIYFKNSDKVVSKWLGTNRVEVVNTWLEGMNNDLEKENTLLNETDDERMLRKSNHNVYGTIQEPEPTEDDFQYGSLQDKYGRTIERDEYGNIIKDANGKIIVRDSDGNII